MIQIIEKPDWVSWDDIHNVLWEAHEENRRRGINMRYPTLSGNDIMARVTDSGKMYVAVDNNKIIGTTAFTIKNLDLWCGKGNYAYLCFSSILPEYRGQGIYKKIMIFVENEIYKNGLSRIMFDTHEQNSRMTEISLRQGYQRISYRHYCNHYNIVFVKWLTGGCPYSKIYCKLRYYYSWVRAHVHTILHTK